MAQRRHPARHRSAENNVSETAFVRRHHDDWDIRWFTPQAEVDLCGHATLASAFVLFRNHRGEQRLRFFTREVGELFVHRRDDVLADGGHYSCLYNYDFGDDWWVLVRARETQHSDERFFRRLTTAENAWPPEDCGGPRAFRHLRVLREKQQRGGGRMGEGEKEFLAWAEGWDSIFDLEATAKAFDSARKPKDRY